MRRPDLVPDCASCAGLCCIATSFDASEDFAFTKAAGVRCPHLTPRSRCAIHGELAARGFSGCAIYDCYGAGPRVTRDLAGAPARLRDEAFRILRVIHELLWLLTEAAKLPIDLTLGNQLSHQVETLDAIAELPPPQLLELDLRPHSETARSLLRRVGDALGGRRRHARALVVVD